MIPALQRARSASWIVGALLVAAEAPRCTIAHERGEPSSDDTATMGDASAADGGTPDVGIDAGVADIAFRTDVSAPRDVASVSDDVVSLPEVTGVADVAATGNDVPAAHDSGVVVDTGPPPNFATMPSDTNDTDYNGNWSITSYSSVCNDNEVVVGVVGNSSDYVNSVGVHCATLNADGTLTNDNVVGPNGGSSGDPFDDRCPTGQVVVSDQGRSGSIVDAFGATCAPLAAWLATGATGTALPQHGGTGGSPWTESCPAGYVGHGLDYNITSYNWHDRVARVRLKCIRVTR